MSMMDYLHTLSYCVTTQQVTAKKEQMTMVTVGSSITVQLVRPHGTYDAGLEIGEMDEEGAPCLS